MKRVLKIHFEWKIISEDGLLSNPREIGPYYSRQTLKGECFDTEEEAYARLIEFDKLVNEIYDETDEGEFYYSSDEYVLVRINRMVSE